MRSWSLWGHRRDTKPEPIESFWELRAEGAVTSITTRFGQFGPKTGMDPRYLIDRLRADMTYDPLLCNVARNRKSSPETCFGGGHAKAMRYS
ncbi:uncharacterized protein CIMG_12647 [Coccidioides immitis RS]|uniref:Uncharacterized protein n=1 Tax=Coccidioides immitis (strain RS) TaxID=246410 RepID=J3KLT1_COCIM|nr:uncharacterized protein CIMG_12647 [Coccidioides immitis RS]EAS37286.3 hypothetical protein CIMG_12647 [Coccidioides immitis RS]